jgi:hypothetical protein
VGDVPTHAQITAHVTQQLQKFVPASSIPVDDYAYLEIGNYLTDVCQFRDPPSYHKFREQARQTAKQRAGRLSGFVDIDGWANDIFGTKSGSRHGTLAQFLRRLVFGVTHQIFDTDGLPTQGARLGITPGGAAPAVPAKGLPPSEVNRIFADRFTQYFPHEHLDDLPVARPEQRKDRLFQAQPSKLIGYLEWYLKYVAEELAKLELDWIRRRAAGLSDRDRHDLLSRLGHLLHAVEDHFFHSNTTEVHQWQFLTSVRRLRRFDPATPEGRTALFERGLLLTGLDQNSVPLRRALQRRLRYPVYEGEVLSRRTSNDGIPMLFTGTFGDTDIHHTLGGALEAIEDQLSRVQQWQPVAGPSGPLGSDPRTSKLVLIRLLFSAEARRAMVASNGVAAMREEHATQLVAGAYPPEIEAHRKQGRLCQHAADLFVEAFAVDREVQERFGAQLPGPGAALITLLGSMQAERDRSADRTRALDSDAKSIMDPASDNGASAEKVGTHSLMSKDSASKQPLRQDAVALAAHASATIATLLLRRVESRTPASQGIDWGAVLRFLVRYPKHPSPRWEEQLIIAVRNGGSQFRQPDVDKIADQPRFPLLGPAAPGAAELERLRNGDTRQKLEAYYAALESDPR